MPEEKPNLKTAHWDSFELQQLLKRLAAQGGVDIEALLYRCELSPEQLAQTNSQVSVEQELALYIQIAQHNQDPLLALVHGQTTSLVQCGTLGMAMQCCYKLKDAIELLSKYASLYSSQINLSSRAIEGKFQSAYRLLMEATPVDAVTQIFELESTFVAFKRIFEELLLDTVKIQAVHFSHSIDSDKKSALEAYFGCSVYEQAEFNGLDFTQDFVQKPLPCGVPEALPVVSALCDKEVYRLNRNSSFLWQFKNYLSTCTVVPDLDACSDHFCVSARSLRRRLAEYDTSFQQELDKHRYLQAKQMLLSSDCSQDAIAESLGFSETRSFRLAFKRWSGQTPQQFRDGHI